MNRVIAGFIVVLSILLAFGIDISALIGPVAVLYIIASAFRYMLMGKLPAHFLLVLLGLLIGPILLCWMIRYLLCQVQSMFGHTLGSVILLLLLLLLMALSFFYVRFRINQLRGKKDQLHTNERHPVLPVHQEAVEKEFGHARDKDNSKAI